MVSEEEGKISLVREGRITRDLDAGTLAQYAAAAARMTVKWIDRDEPAAFVAARAAACCGIRTAGGPRSSRNFLLKLLSLVAAFSLWLFVNAGERDTEIALQVPLELRNIPAHLMITSPRVDFIDLRVSGPRTLLGRIDRSRSRLSPRPQRHPTRPGRLPRRR